LSYPRVEVQNASTGVQYSSKTERFDPLPRLRAKDHKKSLCVLLRAFRASAAGSFFCRISVEAPTGRVGYRPSSTPALELLPQDSPAPVAWPRPTFSKSSCCYDSDEALPLQSSEARDEPPCFRTQPPLPGFFLLACVQPTG
jgi:hypothetical protein